MPITRPIISQLEYHDQHWDKEFLFRSIEAFHQDAVAHFVEECEIIEDLSIESEKESATGMVYRYIEDRLMSFAQDYTDSEDYEEEEVAHAIADYGISDVLLMAHRQNMLDFTRRTDTYTFNTMLFGLMLWTETDINDIVEGVIEFNVQKQFYKAK
jgi:hypothetical protein